jgi:tetratricopeptide (TPR) repeat protein
MFRKLGSGGRKSGSERKAQRKEAIQKYKEAGATALNEAIADGRAENMEDSVIRHSGDVEGFREENRALVEKSAESNFKVGRSYMQLGKFKMAVDCFNRALKIGILPPDDAIAYLNRGDVHERTGAKNKAKAYFQQAANLFKKHKLPSYHKLSEKRLQGVTPEDTKKTKP